MTTNPNQGQRPDATESYGGYGGYRPSNSVDDPYGNTSQKTAGAQQSDPNYLYGQRSQVQQQPSMNQTQQQQYSYEPPESVIRRERGRNTHSSASSTSAASQGSIAKSDRKAALYSYLGFCFTGFFFFFFKKKSHFVRFHAAQSMLLFGPITALLLVLKIISIVTLIPFIGWVLSPIISLLTFIVVAPAFLLWITLMVLAYQGVRVKLPIVGHYAEAMMARFASEKRTV